MYQEALFAAIRGSGDRETPNEAIAALAARDTRPELKTFFELYAKHDADAVTAGDFSLWGTVGDPAPDDSPRTTIGATHGGDVFVVAEPGSSSSTKIALLSHEEQFSETRSWPDLESFLEERIADHRERMKEEFPDDEASGKRISIRS